MEENQNHTTMLADIKASLAVNTNETSNIKTRVVEMQADVKETKTAVQVQNGRVRTLEDWCKEAQKIIETNSRGISGLKTTRIQIWTSITILLVLGGTILTLAVMAIDNKIKDGITQALEPFESDK